MRAMILAAGRGERMRPLTDTTPKPLLEAGGKPLIVWHIERLAQAGITELVINHAWLGPLIVQALGNGERFGVHIRYSAESQPLETAGGIAHAIDLLGADPFLVINSDIWCDWNPHAARDLSHELIHRQKQAWLLLTPNPVHHPQGDFCLQSDGLVFVPSHDHSDPTLTFTGIGIYQPDFFRGMPRRQPAALAPLLRCAMNQHQIIGEHFAGHWMDIGTPQRLNALDLQLHNKHLR